MNLQFDFSNLFKGEEESRDSTPETGSEYWLEAMTQRREEMKRFMALGVVGAADERAELLRALNHARRAIDACAPYAETVEAMSAPEFRDQINRLMVSFAEVARKRPDSHESVWDVAGRHQPYLRAVSNEGREGA
ncbi:hypothetical protein [Gluconobacter kondonii]|uniref:Uncharacterized protein n=1 Tax=Gluconobacter kondonii TaxID=941463 RepID=A0ABQ5WVV3_9PROT|nr:hypothetical protein [Gluconobacter kondonii]GBR35001.1 hypothetical protein AA3266_2006 [Gluconobacter kondonii NBRC 3266]GLQ67180.1 hypothetical protein GCM10007870_27650 [Gluconobacter kondonii]